VFSTPTGLPLDTDGFVELRWHRALRATGTRPRKFFATRHTFISVALSSGCKAKWVAKYCGTSLEMLDKHYGRWMDDDQGQLELLAPRGATAGRRGPKPPKPGPNRIAATSTRSGKRRGEIRTSRGQRACRARKPRKFEEFRTERGAVGTAAESRNDPQEPNLTRESGNGSRSRPRGIAHPRATPATQPSGSRGSRQRVRRRARCTSCAGSSFRASATRWPSATVGACGHVAKGSKARSTSHRFPTIVAIPLPPTARPHSGGP